MNRPPSLFISHGSPMILLDDCPARGFFGEFGAALERPSAILMVSAHWETPGVAAGAAARLAQAGLEVAADPLRGLDHGAWVPLAYMFPDADVPVAQVSIQSHLGPRHHLAVGAALAPLRADNVLIVGSGNVTHGRRAGPVDTPPLGWVAEFSDWVHRAVDEGRTEDLVNYRALAPYAAENHPTEDHYLPLLVALGAGGDDARAERIHTSCTYGTIAMDCYAFD